MKRLQSLRKRDSGASLVEFAVLMPLLLILILGIIEFGWLFGQYNDVKHGAREGARFAAVNGDGAAGNSGEHTYICTTMDGLDAGMSALRVQYTVDPDGNGETGIGEPGRVLVEAEIASLSGVPLITSFLPTKLVSEIEFRIEQIPNWVTDGAPTAVSC